MEIREASEEDIPSIVQLLKLSLGESLMPKSEEFWRWKHVDNPFGASPVVLAWEGEELIGVRAFMRWEWMKDGKVIKAVRAVDTATHPAHQGKGIFTRLTMHLVEQCKAEGVDFIFNTPNKISYPGYLKMGWQSAGRLPIKFNGQGIHLQKQDEILSSWDELPNVFELISIPGGAHKLVTWITPSYLYWRYRDNPNVKYHLLMVKSDRPFILVYRKRKIKMITEVRITELLGNHRDALQALRSVEPFSLITLSGCHPAIGFISWSAGPVVTIRNLNLPSWKENLTFDQWAPSLGDLELF